MGRQIQQGQGVELGAVAAPVQGHRPPPPFHSVDPGGKDVAGGVADAGVDIPFLRQGEPLRRLPGVLEDKGRALINGHRPGPGGGVGQLLPGVELDGLKFHLVLGHGKTLLPIGYTMIIRHWSGFGNLFFEKIQLLFPCKMCKINE